MKFFAVFAAILALSAAHQSTWTLQEIDAALQNPNTDPAIIPYLEVGLNKLIAAILGGEQVDSIVIPIPGSFDKPELDSSPGLDDDAVPEPNPVPEEKPVPEPKPLAAPLVQVIINVNKKQQIFEVAPGNPAIVPTPIDNEEAPGNLPPSNPIDIIAVNPSGVDNSAANPRV